MQENANANCAEIAGRFDRIIGYGWRKDLAEAADVRVATISEQFARGQVATWVVALLEFFEATPPAKWPPRWAKLAARAKAKAKKEAQAA